MVVEFPFSYPEGTKLAAEMTAIDQLKEVKRLQEEWSDNSVSCTVYYRKEELPEIREYLKKNYRNGHKSLSFLLHSDHGFHQAPIEEITKEVYDQIIANTTLITKIEQALDLSTDDECAGGACPIR
jgi:dihydroxyacetone kinase